MHKIHILDDLLINQIAAGEVVERPASALKEIIENSIDAKADKIDIYLKNGGIKSIIVTDNGIGIDNEDLQIALHRHTTSKINKLNDLYNISTLGFRGEGLASIASISKLSLISKTSNNKIANKVKSYNGIIEPITPCNHNVGTTVEVEDIFFNTPARKKFLKSEKTEFNHCVDIIEKLSLVNPQISFSLIHNDKKVLFHSKGSQEDRIKQIFGNDFFNNSIKINVNHQHLKLSAYSTLPTYKHKNNKQLSFVNNRFIKDKIIMHAIKSAYKDVLHNLVDISFIVFLTISPDELDVNVHPTKSEVKFLNPNAIYQIIFYSFDKAIKENNSINKINNLENDDIEKNGNHMPNYYNQNTSSANYQENQSNQGKSYSSYNKNLNYQNNNVLQFSNYQTLYEQKNFENLELNIDNYPFGFAIAQLFDTFILSQAKNNLILIDIHAAHERIQYEKLKKDRVNNNIAVQDLLIPYSFQANDNEIETIKRYLNLFNKYFHIKIYHENEIQITSVPQIINKYDTITLIKNMLRELYEYGISNTIELAENKILATIACRSAIKSGDKLNTDEMNAILREMEKTPKIDQCNHGRPTWVEINIEMLNKFFLRGK